MSEEDTVCPHCKRQLSSGNEVCPFCKKLITGEDAVCPHCGNLLIYEYPKQVAAHRNRVLFPLGFLLLFSLASYGVLYWRGLVKPDTMLSILFMILWLVGLAFYGAYMGKGDRDFWWGR